jgi:hypothetical protein
MVIVRKLDIGSIKYASPRATSPTFSPRQLFNERPSSAMAAAVVRAQDRLVPGMGEREVDLLSRPTLDERMEIPRL